MDNPNDPTPDKPTRLIRLVHELLDDVESRSYCPFCAYPIGHRYDCVAGKLAREVGRG